VAILCVAALTAFAGMAWAHEGGWGDEHCARHSHHNFGKFEQKLGLTDAQKAQAKAIFQANREVVKPIIASLRTERKNLRSLMDADKIDEAAIRAETAKIAGIQADLNVNRAKVGAQFRAILTPEQLAKMKTLRQRHQEKGDTTTTAPAPTN
ncbi:MAG TPA: Spy/CpxP family protein refolding chaperone, partial [Geobacteraceae bacterium]|nr:Spy/CpxP family protein refolding chaperone [Geobacteraceae bacterium]